MVCMGHHRPILSYHGQIYEGILADQQSSPFLARDDYFSLNFCFGTNGSGEG